MSTGGLDPRLSDHAFYARDDFAEIPERGSQICIICIGRIGNAYEAGQLGAAVVPSRSVAHPKLSAAMYGPDTNRPRQPPREQLLPAISALAETHRRRPRREEECQDVA